MKITIASLLTLVLFATISCTKTNTVTTIHDSTTIVYKDTVYMKNPLNPITGLWVGKYINAGETDSFYYSYDIQPTGYCISTAIANNSAVAAYGPWQLTGKVNFSVTLTELTSSPTPVIQLVTATYDSVAGTLIGQHTVTQGPAKSGVFRLFRVP